MATLSTTSLNWLADQWENAYPTAVLSGIVGDLAHKARGGYHISRQDQPSTNYSVIRADDKPGNGPNDRASAIDMTMSTADIIKTHTRLRNAWKSNDPRMKYINAWNGWDGEGDAGRYDVVKHTVGTATPDHKWHIHLELRRKYVNDMIAMKAVLSLLKGETLAQYTGNSSIGGSDDVSAADVITALKSAEGQDLLADAVVVALKRDGTVVNDYPDADPKPGNQVNPEIAVSTALKNIANVDTKLVALTNTVNSLAAKLDVVDETAIATSLASNPEFVEALAAGLAANLPTGVDVTPEELTSALKAALRDGVASA